MPDTSKLTLRDLAYEACLLASLIEGLDALHEQADGPEDCIISKRARNAMRPTIEAVIEKGWELTKRIELAENSRRAATEAKDVTPG